MVDYTLDTEVDPSGDISRAANKITVTTMRLDVIAYEYFDYGAGYFVEFEHLFDVQTDNSGSNGFNGVHVLANAIGDAASLEVADDHHVKVWTLNNNSVTSAAVLREWYNGSPYQDGFTTLSLNTPYYHAFKYVPATKVLTNKIYSDIDRTALVTTLTLTLHAAVTWRYRYSTSSRFVGGAEEWTGWVANTDLQEPTAGLALKIVGMFGIGRLGIRS